MSALADFESTFEKSFSRARERTCTIGEFATQTRDKKQRRYFSRCFLSYLPRFSLQVLPQDVVLYALFDRVLESVFSVELRMSPYSFDEQRVFFQRLACMQNFTALIISDIYHADNEFERRSVSETCDIFVYERTRDFFAYRPFRQIMLVRKYTSYNDLYIKSCITALSCRSTAFFATYRF